MQPELKKRREKIAQAGWPATPRGRCCRCGQGRYKEGKKVQ